MSALAEAVTLHGIERIRATSARLPADELAEDDAELIADRWDHLVDTLTRARAGDGYARVSLELQLREMGWRSYEAAAEVDRLLGVWRPPTFRYLRVRHRPQAGRRARTASYIGRLAAACAAVFLVVYAIGWAIGGFQ